MVSLRMDTSLRPKRNEAGEERQMKLREGHGVVQYFEPPEWLVIVAMVAILVGFLFVLRNRRQKPN